jgi:hypothetical protein
MSTQSNPLASFFRRPVIHTRLPSAGAFWEDGALDLPVTGEIPIYPMTTGDEITLRTPDALLNGAGVISVIKSCCPNIIDPWKMPSVDVDAILIAIRIASYGGTMELDAKCPHCSEENTYEIDLNPVLTSIKCPNYSDIVKFNGLEIKLQPQPYFSVNKTNMISYEEQRIYQTITSQDLTAEEKAKQFEERLQRLVDLNMKIIVDSTEYIKSPNGDIVTSKEFLKEFYTMTGRDIVKLVRDWLDSAAKEVAIKPVHVTCGDCSKEFDLTITFDYAHFFA